MLRCSTLSVPQADNPQAARALDCQGSLDAACAHRLGHAKSPLPGRHEHDDTRAQLRCPYQSPRRRAVRETFRLANVLPSATPLLTLAPRVARHIRDEPPIGNRSQSTIQYLRYYGIG